MTGPVVPIAQTRLPLAAVVDRLAGLRGWRRAALALLAGVLLTGAQPPLSLWPLMFLAWPVLFWLWQAAPTPRSAAALGWWAGCGFFLSGLAWVGEAFLVEGGKIWWYLPLMPVAVAMLAGGLALFWTGAFWLAARLRMTGWYAALALALALACAEMLRGSILTGFPWALPAYVWVETPVMQVASVMGSYTLSGLTLLAALLPGTRRWPALGIAVALVAAGWVFGGHRLATPLPEAGPVIRLVQPAIGQRDKWLPENRAPIFNSLVDLTRTPGARDPALVVWPEVAVTFRFDASPDAIAIATEALPESGALAVGSVRLDQAPRRLHNSLLFYGADGAPLGTYDKRALTPFGEYVPYAWVLGRLGIGTLGDGLSGFAPGTRRGPFMLPGLPPVAVLICYEIIFPGLTRRTAAKADWILQVTNDAWFGDSFGPHQHLAQARIRAIETGLPVARAANTGISAMIDPHGRLVATLGLGQRGVLDARLPSRLESTMYARRGESLSHLLLILSGSALAFHRLKNTRKVANNVN